MALFVNEIKAKIRGEMDAKFHVPYVIDVWEVAKAHSFVAESPETNGKRHSLSNGTVKDDTILTILNEKLPGKNYCPS